MAESGSCSCAGSAGQKTSTAAPWTILQHSASPPQLPTQQLRNSPATPAPCDQCHPRSVGFTLIELLVCLGIVVILIGLIFPAFSRSVASSRQLRCQSSLKTFGVALSVYRDDHRGVLPFANELYSLPAGWVEPIASLDGYLSVPAPHLDERGATVTDQPFLCPADFDHGPIHGLSYAYMPAAFMQVVRSPRPAAIVTKMFEQDPVSPLMQDLSPWHQPNTNGTFGIRQILTFDGSLRHTRSPLD